MKTNWASVASALSAIASLGVAVVMMAIVMNGGATTTEHRLTKVEAAVEHMKGCAR